MSEYVHTLPTYALAPWITLRLVRPAYWGWIFPASRIELSLWLSAPSPERHPPFSRLSQFPRQYDEENEQNLPKEEEITMGYIEFCPFVRGLSIYTPKTHCSLSVIWLSTYFAHPVNVKSRYYYAHFNFMLNTIVLFLDCKHCRLTVFLEPN